MGSVSLGAGEASAGSGAVGDIPDMDEIPDMEEEDLEEGVDDATAAPKVAAPIVGAKDASYVNAFVKVAGLLMAFRVNSSHAAAANNNLLQVRTYDVMITYDKFYQTPRIWLIGYDEVWYQFTVIFLIFILTQTTS